MRPPAGPHTVVPEEFLGGKLYFSYAGADANLAEMPARELFAEFVGGGVDSVSAREQLCEVRDIPSRQPEHDPPVALMPQGEKGSPIVAQVHDESRRGLGDEGVDGFQVQGCRDGRFHLRSRKRQVFQQVVELMRRKRRREE